MAYPSVFEVVKDPEFHALPEAEMTKVLMKIDPDFAALPETERATAVAGIRKKYGSAQPDVEPQAPTPTPQPEMPQSAQPQGMQDQPAPQMPQKPEPDLNPADLENYAGIGLEDTAQLEDATKKGLRATSPLYRPVLEGAGAALGAAAGAPGGPVGSVAGGAVGYASGKGLADTLDMYAGVKEKYSGPVESFTEAGKDLATGAALEVGGAAIGAALVPVLRGGKTIFKKATGGLSGLVSKKEFEKQAGNILRANTSEGTIYARNAEEAARIEKEIQGLKFTLGQRTGDPAMIKLERSQIRATDAATQNAEQIAANNEALRAHYDKNFGGQGNIDDLISSLGGKKTAIDREASTKRGAVRPMVNSMGPAPPQAVGEEAVDAIRSAKKPVQATLNELESSIPDYPMTFGNVRKSISEARANKKLSDDQVSAIFKTENKIERILDDRGKTTFTAMGIRRTLNDEISKAFAPGGNKSVGEALTGVRDALEKDLAELSNMARSGKIGEYKGKPVNTDVLADELEKATVRSAQLKASQAPDIEGMVKAIKDKNGFTMMRQYGEDDTSFAARLSRDYKRIFGKDPLMKNTGLGAAGETDKRILELREILNAVEPGKDVASSMKAFNDFASSEYFGKFDKGAVRKALTKGKEATGAATRTEDIPSLFTTVSGAEDLIRAVGQEKASGIMKGHYAYDLLKSATNQNGDIVTSKLTSWLNRNKQSLEKYGLDFSDVEGAQNIADGAAKAAAEFEKSAASRILNSDTEKAIANAIKGNNTTKAAMDLLNMVKGDKAATAGLQNAFADHIMRMVETTAKDIANNPTVSNAAFSRIMKKYEPAMDVLYKSTPEKLNALKTMQRAYEISTRNTRSAIGGGSDTAENVLGRLSTLTHMSRTASVVKGLATVLNKHSTKEIDKLVTRAMFDPEYADFLIRAANGKIQPAKLSAQLKDKIISLDAYKQAKTGVSRAAAVVGTVAAENSGE